MAIRLKKNDTQTKVRVALEALKGEKTIAEITAKYGIHATQINQCAVLDINRSSLYYRPVGLDDYSLMLMHELGRQYIEIPFYGVLKRRVT